ncbi:MAG: phosphatase PAP2 family protein [Burkholderiaceae bacterium]
MSTPPDASADALQPIALLPLAVVAIVLVALATVFLDAGTLNVDGFVAVQSVTRAAPDTLWAMLTICGTGVVAFALLSPTLAWQPRWFAAALAAASLAGLYSNGMKRVFALPRPASVLDPSRLHVIGETLHANSFPSGHAVTAFTLAALLVLASKKPLQTASWAVPFALLIAFSRIAVGAHWPADIAAGAAGGWICGALGVVIVVRWRIWNTMVGARVMGVVAIGIGVSLFIIDLGYPLALPLQYFAGVVAIASGIAAIARPRLDPLLPHRADAR